MAVVPNHHDSSTVAALERAALSAWPALATLYDGAWVLRFADGHTKRANSVSCLGPDRGDLDSRIEAAVAAYARRGLPPIFRITPLASPDLDMALARRGWRRFDESIVMVRPLSGLPDAGAADVLPAPSPRWLDAQVALGAVPARARDTLSAMLDRLVPTAGYLLLRHDARVVATALAVADGPLVGLFDVAVARDERRRGHGRRITGGALAWGKSVGATVGWLQVVAGNTPAVSLYRGMGFVEAYRYHYRMPEPDAGTAT